MSQTNISICDDNEDNDVQEVEINENSAGSSTTELSSSWKWLHFDKISGQQIQCRKCQQLFSVKSGNSTLRRHYKKHEEKVNSQTLDKYMKPIDNTKAIRSNDDLLDFIINGQHSLSTVEEPKFRAFVSSLKPSFVVPSRRTITRRLEARFLEMRSQLIISKPMKVM